MLNFISVAAATAVATYDIAQGAKWRRENYPRVWTGIGFTGSAAAGDCDADIFVNGIKVGEVKNLKTDWPSKDYILEVAIPVPANALIEIKMVTGATTNPINVVSKFTP